MTTIELHSIEIVDDAAPLALADVLACMRVERAQLVEMVDAGVVTPAGATIEQWTFVRGDLRRLQAARRLMTDLDVNSAGAALILDLLAEREMLIQRLRAMRALAEEF